MQTIYLPHSNYIIVKFYAEISWDYKTQAVGIKAVLRELARFGVWDCRRAEALRNDAVRGLPWSHHCLTEIELVRY